MNRHRALASCLSMISAQTRSAFVARENRFTLFRIMPYAGADTAPLPLGINAASTIAMMKSAGTSPMR